VVPFVIPSSLQKAPNRCYYLDNDGQEQTLWMKPEQKFITEYKNVFNQETSQFSLQFYKKKVDYDLSKGSFAHL
jgi:hypothetical protein